MNLATRSIDEIEQRATSAIDNGGKTASTINSKFNFIVFLMFLLGEGAVWVLSRTSPWAIVVLLLLWHNDCFLDDDNEIEQRATSVIDIDITTTSFENSKQMKKK